MRLLAFAFTIVFVWTGPKCSTNGARFSGAIRRVSLGSYLFCLILRLKIKTKNRSIKKPNVKCTELCSTYI